MGGLFNFLYRKREYIVFLLLEAISLSLIFNFNIKYSSDFFNAKNEITGSVERTITDIQTYFKLDDINQQLLRENEVLRNSLYNNMREEGTLKITTNDYRCKGYNVIANTFRKSINFISLEGGRKDSVERNLGVVSSEGVAGIIQSVSKNFAVAYSLLHPNVLISSEVKRTKTVCTVQWDQISFFRTRAHYIPRHVDLKVGDTIVTSGYNSVFPPGLVVGIIDKVKLEDYMTFYEVWIRLATDFTSLSYVYVVKNLHKKEIDSLEL